MAADVDQALERYEKAKAIHEQVCTAVDYVMGIVEVGKSRELGKIPFINDQESVIARCLVTLLQLKRELEYNYPGLK